MRPFMNLNELREVFRKRMKEVDFCIGEEQVEILFRELLGEPEPPEIVYDHHGHKIGAQELSNIIESVFTPEKIKGMFERDSAFFEKLKK